MGFRVSPPNDPHGSESVPRQDASATDAQEPASVLSGSRYDVVRILLAIALIVAGLLKGHALATAGPPMASSRDRLVSGSLVGFELVFALWLVAGFHPRATRRGAQALLFVFSCVSLFKALAGETSCGCFGRLTVSPWITLSFDVLAFVALLRWTPKARETATWRSCPIRRTSLISASALIMIVIAIITNGAAPGASAHGRVYKPDDFVTLRPETWVGKEFWLLKYIDIGDRLAAGRWTVVLYHHDCDACRRAIPRYEALCRRARSNGKDPRVALIEIPPYASANATRDASCALGRLSDTKVWSVVTPAEVVLNDGVVEVGASTDGSADSDSP